MNIAATVPVMLKLGRCSILDAEAENELVDYIV